MVEFKSLHKGAVEPQQTDDYSIGYDLVVPTDVHIPAHSRFYVPLGFAIGLPKHIEGKIEPRSGFSGKGIEGIGKKWGGGSSSLVSSLSIADAKATIVSTAT